ncbi:hypothetical protein [Halalkalicoccus subterraneus]|uniref:hypothetical protein n=1 Tax=Halalkalicoccus subterraneus TaxID=2675002 RepID=UPI000EFCE7E4|nr:hypothetical protein [Halalkalicoccus subterraneus]
MPLETDDAMLEQVSSRLMSQGVYIEDADRDDERLTLEYETLAPGDGVPHQQIGTVINTFRDVIEQGWEPTTIEATVADVDDGHHRGSWRMDEEWLLALENGELSEVEFSGRVLDTLEEPSH